MIISLFVILFIGHSSGQLLGGREKLDPNDPELRQQAIFAIKEYNVLQNSHFELFKVINGTKQLVSGILYDFFVRLNECDKNKTLDCHFVTWVVPWLNEQTLEFSSCQFG